MSLDGQLAKAVHGDIERQEMFDDAGKEVDAAAHEAVFVELEFDAHAAHEGNAVVADDARETAFTANADDAFDLLFELGGGALIEAQNFLERLAAAFDERKIVE
jgi:putative intracellular protease/amidase